MLGIDLKHRVRLLSRITLCFLALAPGLGARTWTDNKGRTIEADLVRVENDTAIVSRAGKEVRLPLAMLVEADQEFAKNAGETPAAPVGQISLAGNPLETGGKMNLVEIPFSADSLKIYSREKATNEKVVKIAVALPDGFDPAKPQKYFIVYTAVNNDAEAAGGHIAKFGMYDKACMEQGWVCLAVDSNNGVPRGTLALRDALVQMEKDWPGLRSSMFATGGFSGGAKGCWSSAALLVKLKYHVSGVFLGGCNEDRSETNREREKAPSSDYHKIRCYVSMGKTDEIATIAQSEGVMKSLKSNRFREIRSGVHDGGHSFYQPHFSAALKWFGRGGKD